MAAAQWRLTSLDFAKNCIAEFSGSVLNPLTISVADFEVLNEELKQFSAPYKQKLEKYRKSIYWSLGVFMGCLFCTAGLSACCATANLIKIQKELQDLWVQLEKDTNAFVAKRNQSLAESGMMLVITGSTVGQEVVHYNNMQSVSTPINEIRISLIKGNQPIVQPVSLLATPPMKV
jgi:hypothetical protein